MTLTIQCVTVDAHNPRALAEFWAEVLGWSVGEDGDDIGWWIEREALVPKVGLWRRFSELGIN